MHFAGRDFYILFICIIHVGQISSEDHACILAENLYQRTYDNILVIA